MFRFCPFPATSGASAALASVIVKDPPEMALTVPVSVVVAEVFEATIAEISDPTPEVVTAVSVSV